MSADLQRLFTQPRDRNNSRYAREYHAKPTVDSHHPSISYNLIDKRDYSKYHVLNDAEVEAESLRSKELSRKLVATWQGRPTSASSTSSRSQSRQKFIPPKLGMMSKSAKKEARAWDKSINSIRSSGSIPGSKRTAATDTIRRLTESRSGLASDIGSSVSYMDSTALNPSRSIISTGDDTGNIDLQTVVEVMKTKFIENIHVVDKLYDENKFMEKRIAMLEKEIRSMRGENTVNTEPNDQETQSLLETTSAREMERRRVVSPKPRPRSASNPAKSSRPISSRRFTISPSLQADLDRYNQRMEMNRAKEQQKQRLQEEYELLQKERLLRVSSSPSFIFTILIASIIILT